MVNATFARDYLTAVITQVMSQGYACGIKTSFNVHRVIYISSTSTSVYLIAYSALSSPVFNISTEASSFIIITSKRIA